MECRYGMGMNCSDKISDRYLTVNNVGYYKNIDVELTVKRMNGRTDYQLIYIEKGTGSFVINGRELLLDGGTVIIFRPGDRQVYSFSEKSDAEFYWIHFSGVGAEQLLTELRLCEPVLKTGCAYKIKDSIEKMVSACDAEEFFTPVILSGMLVCIFSEISRKLYSKDTELSKVIRAMNGDASNDLNNKDYAKMCGMSEYHFIRKFKECTGFSPLRFKTKIRMEKACGLLLNTSLSIGEISRLCGYDDSLYFSRVFKKITGSAPSVFAGRKDK